MKLVKWMESHILKIADILLPGTLFDRLVLERRRRVNNITGYYPEAVFFSKEKSKKKYCVVRFALPNMAFMASGIQYIFCYRELIKRGYIPILDIEYIYSYKQGRLGEANVWDECFKQPITASQAEKECYVLATGNNYPLPIDKNLCLEINGDELDHFIHVKKENFRAYYARVKHYVEPIWQVKDEVIESLDKELWDKVKGKRVLGVFLREDFSSDRKHVDQKDELVYKNHPMLPSVREIISIIKEQLQDWKYDYVFVSTLYHNSIKIFIEEFHDKVIFLDRIHLDINKLPDTNFGMNEEELYDIGIKNYEKDMNINKCYLKDIVALSRCNYLIGGASSGTASALIMNGGKYDDIHILEDIRKINRY